MKNFRLHFRFSFFLDCGIRKFSDDTIRGWLTRISWPLGVPSELYILLCAVANHVDLWVTDKGLLSHIVYIALIIVLSIFLRVNGHGSTLNSATTHIDLDWKAIVYRVCAKERAQWKYAMEKCASQMKVSATKELHQECAARVCTKIVQQKNCTKSVQQKFLQLSFL